MKIINRIFLFSLIWLLSINLNAQNYDTTTNYIKQLNVNVIDTTEGNILNGYADWIQFYENRLDENGDIQTYVQNLNAYYQSESNSSIDLHWEYIGHNNNYHHGGQSMHGLIMEIWVDTTDFNHILAGTEKNGLWETYDNGDNWLCISDTEPRIKGIASLEVINDTIYIATNSNEENQPYYTNGLFYSGDHGLSWQEQLVIKDGQTIFPTSDWKFTITQWLHIPQNPSTQFLLTNNFLLKSVNNSNIFDTVFYKPVDSIWYNPWYANNTLKKMLLNPNNANELFVSGPELLRVSIPANGSIGGIIEDMSDNLLIVSNDTILLKYTNIGSSKLNPEIFWISAEDTYGNAIMVKYNDITDNYDKYSVPLYGNLAHGMRQVEISPFDDNIISIGDHGNIYLKLENGSLHKYNRPKTHIDIRASKFYNENDHLVQFIGTDGGIGKLIYEGTSITPIPQKVDLTNDGTNGIINYDMRGFDVSKSMESDMMLLAQNHNGVAFAKDNEDWISMFSQMDDGKYCQFSKSNPVEAYFSCSDYNQLRFYNTETEDKKDVYYFTRSSWNDLYNFEVSPNDSRIVYTGQRGKKVNNNTTIPAELVAVDCHDLNSIQKYYYHFSKNLFPRRYAAAEVQNYLYVSTTHNKSSDSVLLKFEYIPSSGFSVVKDITPALNNISTSLLPNGAKITSITLDPNNPDRFWISFGGCNSFSKVWMTEDDGDSFFPYSTGLPDGFPVNEVLFDEVTNQLYAVNDVGIFYYSEKKNEWQNITGDLPPIYCNFIRFSPDHRSLRLGSRSRGPWEASLCIPEEGTIDITSDQTWDQMMHINSDLIIHSGATLTVTNTLYFISEAKVIIKAGGKLILDGGTLTNLCPERWQGVEVLGNPNSSDPNEQGKLVIQNNSTIENAEVAVRNFFIEGGYNTGGIVQATEADFINNKTAIKLKLTHYDLTNNYYSFFQHCTFETNDEYLGTNNFNVFADLNSVNDVIFNDCEFLMENSMHQGTGINAAYSNVIVNNHCSFDNLLYGIHLTGDGHTFGSRIETSTFTDIERGIYVGGINEMKITDNNFYIPLSMEPGSSNTYGLYMERCDGYAIEEDTCVSLNPSSKTTIGIYIKNSGRNNNQVYRNVFKDLTYGAIAYGRNRHPDEPGGLCFKCNTFTNNDYDIAVFGKNKKDGIKPNQGADNTNNNPTAPAGNRFSNNGDGKDFDNQGTHINYYYPENTSVPSVKPTISGDIDLFENNYTNWTIEKGCPPSSGGGSGSTTIESDRSAMANNEAKSDSTQNILDLLVDGGDTQGTTQEVETAYPPETYEVYNELMNKSPYLSDKVVKASIEKEEVLPNVMIRDIMVANPQSAKEQELLDKVDERTTPMPDYMKAQILAGKDLVGYMEKLEAEKSHYAQKRANAYHNLIRLYQQDSLLTTEAKLDSVIVLVSAENTLSAQYRLVMLYFAKGDYVAGQNVLAAISNAFALNAEQSTEHSYFTDYYQIATDLAISNDTITTQQISDLEYIMEEEAGLSAAYARNLLIAHNAMDYVEEVLIPEGLHFAARPQEEALQEALKAHNYLSLFPNPAKDYLIVKYELEMEYADAQLQIYDSKGSLIKTIAAENIQDQKVITTTDLKAGTYYIHLYFNNKEMETQKFTIVK